MRHPQVFLFDEPLSNLDAKLRVQMRVELKKLHDRLGTTAIYVTHDQVEAMTLGDRVVVMKDGLVQQVGEPLELYNEPANLFVAGFLGSPAMNFATVKVSGTDGALWAEAEGLRIKVAGRDRRPARPLCRQGGHAGDPARGSARGLRAPTRPNSASTPRSRSSRSSAPRFFSTWRSVPSTMVASVEPTIRANIHDRLRLALNPERLHFFDTQSEAAI